AAEAEQRRADQAAAAEQARADRAAESERARQAERDRRQTQRQAQRDRQAARDRVRKQRRETRGRLAAVVRGNASVLMIYGIAIVSFVMAAPAMASYGAGIYKSSAFSAAGALLPVITELG